MIMWFLLSCLFVVEAARSEQRLTLGPEFALAASDAHSLAVPADQPPAIASDGTNTLIVYAKQNALYAVLLDSRGQVLTPLPRILRPPLRSATLPAGNVEVLWSGGFYHVLSFDQRVYSFEIIKVTREGAVVDV